MDCVPVFDVGNSPVALSVPSSISEVSFYSKMRHIYRSEELYSDLFPSLIKDFHFWVNSPLYYAYRDVDTGDVLYCRASVRGNDVYFAKLRNRLNNATDFLNDSSFDNLLYRSSPFHYRITNVFFITLTFNRGYGSINHCWESVSKEYNRFITAFRRIYGSVFVIRSVEAHKDGYPHIHLFCISEHEFPCAFTRVKRGNRKGSLVLRLNDAFRIKGLWKLGFSDIRGCSNIKSIKNYLFKDIFKCSSLSLALNWVFNKRAFAISGKKVLEKVLGKNYNDLFNLIISTTNSNDVDLIFSNYQFIGVFYLEFKDFFSKVPPNSFVLRSKSMGDGGCSPISVSDYSVKA